MKKLLSVLLLFVMLLLVGCQAVPSEGTPEETPQDEASTPQEPSSDPTDEEQTPFVPPVPYTKQYSYPENMNFRMLDTGVIAEGGLSSPDRKIEYTLPWEQEMNVSEDAVEWKKIFLSMVKPWRGNI